MPIYFQAVRHESGWESFEETPLLAAISTYICYALLVFIGHIEDFLVNIGLLKLHACLEPKIPVSWCKIHSSRLSRFGMKIQFTVVYLKLQTL